MTLFWNGPGLKIVYEKEMLTVEDLNPEIKIRHAISRREMFWIGVRAILSAMKG